MEANSDKPTNLGSVELAREDLRELKQLLDESLHNGQITITIAREATVETYPSLNELFLDGLNPELIRSFEIEFNSRGGAGRIVVNSSEGDYCRLYLDGHKKWCDYVEKRITNFNSNRSNSARTILSGRSTLAPIAILSSILAGHFFITISPLDIFYPAPQRLPLLYSLYIVSASVFFAVTFRHILFPYAYISLQAGEDNLYFQSSVKVLALVVVTLACIPILNLLN